MSYARVTGYSLGETIQSLYPMSPRGHRAPLRNGRVRICLFILLRKYVELLYAAKKALVIFPGAEYKFRNVKSVIIN